MRGSGVITRCGGIRLLGAALSAPLLSGCYAAAVGTALGIASLGKSGGGGEDRPPVAAFEEASSIKPAAIGPIGTVPKVEREGSMSHESPDAPRNARFAASRAKTS